ncbi:MAG TPA: RICIN domain-containing protein [Polyangiaceae bacterium]|nr:RICIN domain-containing protein [Polyangiaceae bacterium]
MMAALLGLGAASTGCTGMAAEDGGEIEEEASLGQVHEALNTAPGEGLYRISPKNAPHKSWDLPGACPGQNNGRPLALYHYDGHYCGGDSGDQKWYIRYAGNDGQNYYEIRQGHANGKCLDIEAGGGTNNLITWDCNGGNWQRWYFTEVEAMTAYGHWKIKSRHNGKVIDLDYGNTENGTKIQVWDDYNNDAQQWIIKRVDGGAGMIEDWSDDFTSVNDGNWNKADWNPGFVNNEKQYYKPWKIWSDGRRLKVDCHHIGSGTGHGNYECGRVNSKNKRYFREGAFSARVKYAEGGSMGGGASGTWPAFWTLGQGVNEHPVYSSIEWYDNTCGWGSNWPRWGSRELDIWEYTRNAGDRFFTAGHAGDGCQSSPYSVSKGDNWFDPNRWYVFKVVFDGDQIKYYRDGALMFQAWNGHWTGQDMFFIINMAVGGNLGGNNGNFNDAGDWAQLEVDWVAHERWW